MEKLLTLGIDPWAIVIYLANTGLVIGVLTYLLYKPVLRILDKRREMIASSMDEAKHLQEAFEKKLNEAEKKGRETEEKLAEELEKLHKFSEQKKAELMSELEKTRSEMMEKAEKEIQTRKDAFLKDTEKEVKNLMAKIILDILENKVPENVIGESVTSGWKKYSSHSK